MKAHVKIHNLVVELRPKSAYFQKWRFEAWLATAMVDPCYLAYRGGAL